MDQVFEYALAAPLIVAALAFVRLIVPEVRGRVVPLLALVLTVAWGVVLLVSGRFDGDLAEFVVGTVLVASASVGGAATVSTYAPSGSTVERVT